MTPGHATEPELRRMAFRLHLFARRGLDEATAGKLAERLLVRDAEQDDRRLCVECLHCQHRTDFDADPPLGWLVCAKHGHFERQQLQRCPQFNWERPT